MNILISNDDGVYASGINILNDCLKKSNDTFVVAPLEERSTTGHTLSLDNPLRIVEINKKENIYGCSGYPADCTIMGFGKLMDKRPDLVVSGINRGANLGQDVFYSGTVAAAREGVFHGIPGVGISLVSGFGHREEDELYFETAASFLNSFIQKPDFLSLFRPHQVVNINVPNLPTEKN
jgi:5'-nucleotidase